MKPALLLVLLAVSLAFAYPAGDITITPFEHKDMGNASLPKFDGLLLKMDCNSSTLKIYAESGNSPVQGATTLLKSTNYNQPLMGSGTTDANGFVAQHIQGNLSFITGFLVLTVEKPGYQEREVHFDINGCLVQSAKPPTQPVPQQNSTPPANTPQPNNSGNPVVPPAVNVSQAGNVTVSQNATGNQTGTGAKPAAQSCPLPLAIFAALGMCYGVLRD